MILKKFYILSCFLILITLNLQGHGGELSRYSLYSQYDYDFKNKISTVGLNGNAIFMALINGGVELKYGNYNNQSNYIFNGFAGIGFLNAVQFQYGYSTNNYSILRFNTEWRLSELGFVETDIRKYNIGNISLKLNVDRAISNKRDWFISFGIGYSWEMF